ASSSITDLSASDGVLASISGNATVGYTVTVASDAATNLTGLAQFIQNNVAEAATVSYSGGVGDVFNPARSGESLPASAVSVTGSQAAVTATRSIDITVDPTAFGGNPN